MYVDDRPERKIGVLSPRTVIEYTPYEFYRLAPPGVVLVMIACGLEEYSVEEIDRIFEPLDRILDLLMDREVEMIVQNGVPLPLLLGVERYAKVLDHIRRRTGLPVTSQIDNVLAATKHMGLKKIVVANKWSDAMNANLVRFFNDAGITVVGVHNKSLSPRESAQIKGDGQQRIVYGLAAEGLKQHPEADGIYIGGGSWKAQPVAEQLERDLRVPIVSNTNSMVWHILSEIGMWRPIPGQGRLLSGD
jgi:maleate cis-trans isomerase